MDAEEQQREQEHISFDQLKREPVAVFTEVERGKRVIVEYGGKSYRISPVRRRSKARKSHRLTPDDPILGIIGIADSHGPGDVSLRVDDYLAQAYMAEFERPEASASGDTDTQEAPAEPPLSSPHDNPPSSHE